MEGMILWEGWLIYLLAGLLGCWCWQQLFFWLPEGSWARHLCWAPGWALLLSPGPSSGENSLLAPAFIGVAFGVLNKDPEAISSSLVWLIGGLCCALIIISAFHVLVVSDRKDARAASRREGRQATRQPS